MPSTDQYSIDIRRLRTEHADTFLALVDALADFEKLPRPEPEARERLLRDALGDSPRIEAFLAWIGDDAVGYAITFQSYSSFLALPTQYLEDVFVLPAYRKRGVGFKLFLHVAQLAHERGCGRMEWAVLDWNTPALEFYERLGARQLKEWQLFRLTSSELAPLADMYSMTMHSSTNNEDVP